MTSFLARRAFLQTTGGGQGAFALSQMLAADRPALVDAAQTSPLAPKPPHFAPKAKRVIFLFMAGAPSQLDLFDPKPLMKRYDRKAPPAALLEGLRDPLIKGSARIMASPRTFKQHGQCRMDFSDYLPHLAKRADDLCMIRSMTSEVSNHHPGQLLVNCGVPRFGFPSTGS